jgi:uncharacterized membrane-anchored protein YhcB (DUF1043 family)
MWLGVIGFVIGIAVGVAAGVALEDSPDPEAQPPQAGSVPASCLDAIAAARDRLLLNPEVTATLRDYRQLGERVADGVSRLRIPDLRGTLSDFNDLSDRSSALLERSVDSRFSEAADDCEKAAGVTPQPSPS